MTGETIRVSVASDGSQGNEESFSPSISDNGRSVAFESAASNLVPGGTNECTIFPGSDALCNDIFVHEWDGANFSGKTWGMAPAGTTVTYTLSLRNMRVISDTFALALSGGSWDVLLVGPETRSLAPGDGYEVTVVVSPLPQASTIGDTNIVTLSATSEASPFMEETLELTTVTAGDYNWFFPVVFRP